MERHFDDMVQKLNTNLLQMAALTEKAIYNSVEALKTLNRDLAESTIQEDQSIDELENVIEEEGINLLALFQPLATDLRFITTAMRISTDLERIADLAVNICQRARELVKNPPVLQKPMARIPALAEIAQKMVKESIDAFVRRDLELARQVIFADKSANQLRTAIIHELVYEHMAVDGGVAPRAVPLLLVARDLERICDQATDIAQETIYMVEAIIVKHHPERLRPLP